MNLFKERTARHPSGEMLAAKRIDLQAGGAAIVESFERERDLLQCLRRVPHGLVVGAPLGATVERNCRHRQVL